MYGGVRRFHCEQCAPIGAQNQCARLTAGPRSAMIRRVIPLRSPPLPRTRRRPALVSFLPMILIFGIFYFILIAPMRKRQKKTQQMLAQLKKATRSSRTADLRTDRRDRRRDRDGDLQVSDQVKIKIARALARLRGPRSS
jgi:preprotein translocase subunit YajC